MKFHAIPPRRRFAPRGSKMMENMVYFTKSIRLSNHEKREEAALRGNIDFTRGGITGQLILFSIPIILGELFQNLYNSVDSLVVGNFVGSHALAAVSVCSTLSNLLIGFFTGMSIGASVVVSRVFGGGNHEELSSSIRVSFTFSVVLGMGLSVLGILLTPQLVRLSAAPPEVYAEAVVYLRIYLAGLMFTVIYNIGAGSLRAGGDSRHPFLILLVSCCINIVLDLLFVVRLPLGVAGVGIATVISQCVSVLLVCRRIFRYDRSFRLAFGELARRRGIIADVTGIGMPSGLQSALISFSNLFVWRYIGGFGPAAMAGVGVAQRLDKFVSMPCKSFGLTITTFVSQNTGAGNHARARRGIQSCLLLGLGVTWGLGFLVYRFAVPCVSLFNSDPQVVEIGVAMMRTIVPLYFFLSIREVYLGVLRGYGNTRIPMLLSLIGMVGLRQVFLAVSMRLRPSLFNIYICYPLAWGTTAAMIAAYYLLTRRRYEPDGQNV